MLMSQQVVLIDPPISECLALDFTPSAGSGPAVRRLSSRLSQQEEGGSASAGLGWVTA
jgi:hypothetical protein